MGNDNNKNIKLGIFVLVGTIFLIVSMYLIGAKQSLFSSTIKVSAVFHTVNGLMPGSNVRFAGIDVGTVEKVEIQSDSSVLVTMLIEEKSVNYIYKNAVASIGSDGLMGNKLININSAHLRSNIVQDGDVLLTIQPIETEGMMRTLGQTNDDVSTIARNLRIITDRINHSNTLWTLLMDPSISENLKSAIVSICKTGEQSAIITGDLSEITSSIKNGKGTLGALITDTVISNQMKQTIVKIHYISDTMAQISGDLKFLTAHVKKGEGAIGALFMDTLFAADLKQSLLNVKHGSKGLNENLEAIKSSFLLKKYFKKQDKKKAVNP
jgi:phospholipid/cholesterol/gamma-HCH transport system substrate-binding protein